MKYGWIFKINLESFKQYFIGMLFLKRATGKTFRIVTSSQMKIFHLTGSNAKLSLPFAILNPLVQLLLLIWVIPATFLGIDNQQIISGAQILLTSLAPSSYWELIWVLKFIYSISMWRGRPRYRQYSAIFRYRQYFFLKVIEDGILISFVLAYAPSVL